MLPPGDLSLVSMVPRRRGHVAAVVLVRELLDQSERFKDQSERFKVGVFLSSGRRLYAIGETFSADRLSFPLSAS
jgi:hypothetical protein